MNICATKCAGLVGVEWKYDPSYRNCRRVVMQSRPLVHAIYTRLLSLLSDAKREHVRPFAFDGGLHLWSASRKVAPGHFVGITY